MGNVFSAVAHLFLSLWATFFIQFTELIIYNKESMIADLFATSVRPPRIKTLSFYLMPTSITPAVPPNSYRTLICYASHPRLYVLYEVPVRWVKCLPLASYRFHLAMDTLAFGYSFPAIRVAWVLAPVRQCLCRAYIK